MHSTFYMGKSFLTADYNTLSGSDINHCQVVTLTNHGCL